MKMVRIAVISICAVFSVACVTEGVVPIQPASDEVQAEANLALGIGYLQQERPDLAIEALLRALEAEPRSAEAHSVLALAYDQTESFELAEEHHRRATQLAPRNANIQNSYAVYLCRQNRWADAERPFDVAIAASAGASALDTSMNAARCARRAGDFEAAEKHFRVALNFDAANAEALRGMVDVSIRASNYLQGRAFWQRLERSASMQPDDLLSCYVIESELRDSSAAEDCADRLRQEYPGSAALNRLSELERNAS
jgi:type IV pilus assembly protein PilF